MRHKVSKTMTTKAKLLDEFEVFDFPPLDELRKSLTEAGWKTEDVYGFIEGLSEHPKYQKETQTEE